MKTEEKIIDRIPPKKLKPLKPYLAYRGSKARADAVCLIWARRAGLAAQLLAETHVIRAGGLSAGEGDGPRRIKPDIYVCAHERDTSPGLKKAYDSAGFKRYEVWASVGAICVSKSRKSYA